MSCNPEVAMHDHGDTWRAAGLGLVVLALTYMSRHERWAALPRIVPAVDPTLARPSRADIPPDDPRGIATPGQW